MYLTIYSRINKELVGFKVERLIRNTETLISHTTFRWILKVIFG